MKTKELVTIKGIAYRTWNSSNDTVVAFVPKSKYQKELKAVQGRVLCTITLLKEDAVKADMV